MPEGGLASIVCVLERAWAVTHMCVCSNEAGQGGKTSWRVQVLSCRAYSRAGRVQCEVPYSAQLRLA